MSILRSFTLIFVLNLVVIILASKERTVSIFVKENGSHNPHKWKIDMKDGTHKDAAGWVTYNKTVDSIGWNILSATTNPDSNNTGVAKHFAVGYGEGALTYNEIYAYWENEYSELLSMYNESQLAPVYKFVLQNDNWMSDQFKIKQNDLYWHEVELVMSQLTGLEYGIRDYAPKHLKTNRLQLLLINLNGDLFDLLPAFIPGVDVGATLTGKPKITGHCTGFIRLTDTDLFSAHDTWDSYQTMTRIFKRYNFYSGKPNVYSTNMLFSSYPATLSSDDDFYVLDSGLFVLETSNNNYNMSLYERLSIKTIMSWIRTMVANRLGNNGKNWCETYAHLNSGTYNNQWVVVDYNLYKPGMKTLAPNTVWVLEQIPGLVMNEDVTDIVNQQGYWASYNVPYFSYIYNITDYDYAVKQWGQEFSRNNCSRENIFKRDANNVETLQDMQKIMLYNEFETDPLSSGEACNSIAARCDLDKIDPDASGALDSKITSYELMKKLQCIAIDGPTHETQPVFSWDQFPNITVHFDQPNEFDFDWVLMDFQ